MRETNAKLIKDSFTFKTRDKKKSTKRKMNLIKKGILLFIATRLLPD